MMRCRWCNPDVDVSVSDAQGVNRTIHDVIVNVSTAATGATTGGLVELQHCSVHAAPLQASNDLWPAP